MNTWIRHPDFHQAALTPCPSPASGARGVSPLRATGRALVLVAVLLWSQLLAAGETVRDRLWIWGHPAGVYNGALKQSLGRVSAIQPVAAAENMGLKNMLFIRYEGKPVPPFEGYFTPFRSLERVYWSLVGASGATSAAEREAVFALAEKNENVVGFILDDFFHAPAHGNAADPISPPSPFRASLTPDELRALGSRKVRGRKLPIMAVVYTRQVKPQARAHIDAVDQLCLWTWCPPDLKNLEANFAALKRLAPDKEIFLGCYMYDFSANKPLPVEAMKRQVALGYPWLRAGQIRGMIFLATPNVDVGLEAVDWTRNWIRQTGDKPLPGRSP